MVDVQPNFKQPTAAKAKPKGVRAQRAGTPAALKRKATALWGELVHARDVACVACGKHDGKLDAHHVMVKSYMATRTDERNGLLLCATHHTLGRVSVHNDSRFAEELYARTLGPELYEELRQKANSGAKQRYPAEFWRLECVRLSGLLERYGA